MRSRNLGSRVRPLRDVSRPPGDLAASAAGLVYPLVRGPYQSNGATPWYTELALGTPPQTLKIALDTGSNFNWVTSSLCGGGCCEHHGKLRFDYRASATFGWDDRSDRKVSFGPWGDMIVETGSDELGLTPTCSVRSSLFLSKHYAGPQFAQLDWDGGIGLPASSSTRDPSVSFVVAELMQLGLLDPELPYVSFRTDPAARTGSCRLGSVEADAFDPASAVFLRWSPYLAFPGVGYIWSAALNQLLVGDTLVASNALVCLDSGSSEFKGDDDIMTTALRLVSTPARPDVHLRLGTTATGETGHVLVPPSVYTVEIEAGPDKGKHLPQFRPLGLDGLVLVGSVLMDHLYTVFEYDVTRTAAGYELAPVGIWIFNRSGGPGLIRSRGRAPDDLFARKKPHTL